MESKKKQKEDLIRKEQERLEEERIKIEEQARLKAEAEAKAQAIVSPIYTKEKTACFCKNG